MSDAKPDLTLLSLLAWYREMGVDSAPGAATIDWLRRGDEPPGQAMAAELADADRRPERPVAPQTARAPSTAPAAAPAPVATRRFPTEPPDAAETAARSAARSASSLDELRASLTAFDGCALKATAKSLCFYRGAAQARVMIIGEAPGRDEDLEGRPFVGRSGRLLDTMLAAIGLAESDVHITNVVYWRPPGNRTPTPQEAQVCRPFLERQMELVAPDVIVLLGGPASNHILGVREGIMRLRGKWRTVEIGGRAVPSMPTLHPAYLLRTPPAKRQAWRDLLAIRAALTAAG